MFKVNQNISPTIVDYIQKAMDSGMSKEQVRYRLISAGHKDNIVNLNLDYTLKKRRIKHSMWIIMVVFFMGLFLPGFIPDSHDYIGIPQPIDMALENMDVSYCDDYVSHQAKEGCKIEVSLRQKITSEEKRLIWVAMRTDNFSICTSLPGYAWEVCSDASIYFSSVDDIFDCEKLNTDYMNEYCKSHFYYMYAMDGDASLCEKVILPLGYDEGCREEIS